MDALASTCGHVRGLPFQGVEARGFPITVHRDHAVCAYEIYLIHSQHIHIRKDVKSCKKCAHIELAARLGATGVQTDAQQARHLVLPDGSPGHIRRQIRLCFEASYHSHTCPTMKHL